MTIHRIALSSSRDIPFNKLILSQANVRRTKAGVSIEELAEDIARRTLLQSLTVRPVVADDGVETGMFEIPAGGRRYRALDLLVKQKRLSKTAPVPCVIRFGGIAEEDSLAENIQRAPLHPLDQFRAFLKLREKGQSEEEIAASFFVSVGVVRQRLRLASVSPRLLDAYADDGLTLDQLMAFTINGDHERQEQVFAQMAQSHLREPYAIRRMLTEGSIRAGDKRAQFIGVDAYVDAGGVILNDLFQGDDGGWLKDVTLLERLVAETLEREAEVLRGEGWKWTEVAVNLPFDHAYGLRRLRGEPVSLTEEEVSARQVLVDHKDRLDETYADVEDLPEDIDQRFAELETAISAIDERPIAFDPEEVARAGAFVSIDASGALKIERGFVRPEDERPIVLEPESETGSALETDSETGTCDSVAGETAPEVAEPEEDEGMKPIPDRLMTELTVHRTLALRLAVGERPDIAFLCVVHALCLTAFYRYAPDTCLEMAVKTVSFGAQAPGLADSELVKDLEARHQALFDALPKDSADLWEGIVAMDDAERHGLFAHCVSLVVNAVHEPWNRRPRAMAHADRLAQAVDLDMVAAGWTPTVQPYLGRVTKARILAVREAKGTRAGDRIEHLKKVEMAEQAEVLLAGSGWLPEPLRTPVQSTGKVDEAPASEESEVQADDGTSVDRDDAPTDDVEVAFAPPAIAAE
jgi:ParB family chromosome partitioning protein